VAAAYLSESDVEKGLREHVVIRTSLTHSHFGRCETRTGLLFQGGEIHFAGVSAVDTFFPGAAEEAQLVHFLMLDYGINCLLRSQSALDEFRQGRFAGAAHDVDLDGFHSAPAIFSIVRLDGGDGPTAGQVNFTWHAINRFVKGTNEDPRPFHWTKDPEKIIAAVKLRHQMLDSI
jgi:hypothetical protein